MYASKNTMMDSLLSLKQSRKEDLQVQNTLRGQENEQRGMEDRLLVGI